MFKISILGTKFLAHKHVMLLLGTALVFDITTEINSPAISLKLQINSLWYSSIKFRNRHENIKKSSFPALNITRKWLIYFFIRRNMATKRTFYNE
jgi:hypothetical protein